MQDANDKTKISEMKAYSLDEVKDKFIGKKGTPKRDSYEKKLNLDLLTISVRKQSRKKD